MGEKIKAEEIRRLLSEYAAGTLCDADRRVLFAAALEDQALFEALAKEQPLADLMADPASRTELLEDLREQSHPRFLGWLWKPWPMTAAAAVMVGFLVFTVTLYMPQSPLAPEPILVTRKAEAPAPAPSLAKQAVPSDKDIAGQVRAVADRPAPAPDRLEKRAERLAVPATVPAAAPAAKPLPADEKVVGGYAGGVVGGVVGGVLGPKEPAKGLREAAEAPTLAAEAAMDRNRLMSSRLADAAVASLRYRLLRRTAEGPFQEVPPDTRFTAGDAVRLQLEPQVSGHLAVAELTEEGGWKLIYPQQGPSAERVPAQALVIIPAQQAWEFGPAPRERRLLAVLTTEPLPALVTAGGALLRPDHGAVIEIILRVSP